MKSSFKDTLKYLSRKYFSYDPSLRNLKLEADFLDQKTLMKGLGQGVIFDIGANIGQTTRKYRKLFPEATIHAFEPFPEARAEYIRTTKGSKDIFVHPIALSDKAGEATFFTNKNHYTNSLLPVNPEFTGDKNYSPSVTLTVKTETLDAFCTANNISKIDIMKMDVQGGELMVLKGAEKMLQKGAIKLIYTEVEFTKIYKDQPLMEDLRNYLKNFGYTLHNTYNVIEENGKPLAGDAIFILSNEK